MFVCLKCNELGPIQSLKPLQAWPAGPAVHQEPPAVKAGSDWEEDEEVVVTAPVREV